MVRFRSLFTVLAILWVFAVPAAAFAASRPAAASSAAYGFAYAVYAIGKLICHQRSGRSFFLFGAQLPVCARCTGIYAGAALMTIVAWSLNLPARRPNNAGDALHGAARYVLLLASLPIAATLFYEWTAGETPGSWTRAASGLPLGLAVAWIVCCAAPAERK
jgi:uncharacterized membrane protein